MLRSPYYVFDRCYLRQRFVNRIRLDTPSAFPELDPLCYQIVKLASTAETRIAFIAYLSCSFPPGIQSTEGQRPGSVRDSGNLQAMPTTHRCDKTTKLEHRGSAMQNAVSCSTPEDDWLCGRLLRFAISCQTWMTDNLSVPRSLAYTWGPSRNCSHQLNYIVRGKPEALSMTKSNIPTVPR
ncbi:hypothetical protein N657DRAFT_188104 [Parathielavia appendiculata]|uniref:Uncharacterized protein n=1 Tax=Parathielavia appendiculata TaxID=2587402 RepID=A0AAN6U5W7_9PEZI|nr:hypothetical protein N657DRAFT_188104 [Parathielavia appendiculata]